MTIENDPGLLNRHATNEGDLRKTRQDAYQQLKANRPDKTIKVSPARQEFCSECYFSDGDIVREVKVLLFLKKIAFPMRIPCRRKSGMVGCVIAPSRGSDGARKRRKFYEEDGGYERRVGGAAWGNDSDDDRDHEAYFSADEQRDLGSKPLMPQSIESGYVSALVDLWAQQVVDETNRHRTPRGKLLKALLQANKIDRARHSHDNFEDRPICSLNDGYTALEYRQLARNTVAKTESV